MTFLFVFMYQACVLCSVVTDARVGIQSWPANRIGLAFPLRPNNHFLCLFFFISSILKTPMMLVNNAWHRLSLSARTFCFVVRQCTMNKISLKCGDSDSVISLCLIVVVVLFQQKSTSEWPDILQNQNII